MRLDKIILLAALALVLMMLPAAQADPIASITAPDNGEYVSDSYLINGTANVTSGDSLDYWNLTLTNSSGTYYLENSTTVKDHETLYSWDTTGYADGSYNNLTLRVCNGSDCVTVSEEPVIIDNTGPTASIDSPSDSDTVSGTVEVNGSATDKNFDYYNVSVAGETKIGYSQVSSGTLYNWDTTSAASGSQTIDLTVYDEAGNSDSTSITVTVEVTVTVTGIRPIP